MQSNWVVNDEMMASQFPKPTEEIWRNIPSKFWEKWNFPNCIGTTKGKHVTIVSSAHPGSLCFNYKGTLLSTLHWLMLNTDSLFYKSETSEEQARPFPREQVPQWRHIFNYRLSRPWMFIECAFGILSSRWREFLTKMNVKLPNADSVVTAACILHNYLLNPSENQRWLDEAEERG